MRYRIKYSKVDRMKFIGHLDLLRLFTRAINRAGIPVSYSHGFNPHQLLSFAFPLAIGMESASDYCDMETDVELSCEKTEAFKQSFPSGLEILDIRKLNDGEKNCASCTEYAEYEIRFRESFFKRNRGDIDFRDIVEAMLSSGEIIATRKTKSGLKDSDIRNDIYDIKYDNKSQMFSVTITAGSGRNLKADDLMAYMLKQKDTEFLPTDILYKRIDIFRRDGDLLVPLGTGAGK